MPNPTTPMNRDEFMLKLGFHKHKPSYRGKDLYFQIGGAGVTKQQANSIYEAFNKIILTSRAATVIEAQKQDWWITTGLKQNGKRILGPFSDRDLALSVRTYMEIAEAPATYWVEQSQPNAKETNDIDGDDFSSYLKV